MGVINVETTIADLLNTIILFVKRGVTNLSNVVLYSWSGNSSISAGFWIMNDLPTFWWNQYSTKKNSKYVQ